MEVKEVDEFMADVDEWTLDDIERWEDEEGKLKHLVLKLVKPIAEERVEVYVNAQLVRESSSMIPNPRDGESRAFVFGAKDYFVLTLRKSQDDSIPAQALNFAHECLRDKHVDRVQEIIESQYRLEVMF